MAQFSPREINDLHAIYSLLSGKIFFLWGFGGGVERFVIIPVYFGLKAGLLQSFRVFYQIYVPSFIFSFNFYIIKNTPIKIKNTSSCQIS